MEVVLVARGPRITVEQQDEIVRLRLEGATKAETARQLGIAESTVTRYWTLYLESIAGERSANLERIRLERELVHRARAQRARRRQELEVVTRDAEGTEKLVMLDPRGLAALMGEEARAEQQIDRLLGIDKLVVEATVDISQHAAELHAIVKRGLEIAGADPAVTPEALSAVVKGIATAAREREEV